jgi:hypothetical protein
MRAAGFLQCYDAAGSLPRVGSAEETRRRLKRWQLRLKLHIIEVLLFEKCAFCGKYFQKGQIRTGIDFDPEKCAKK